MQIIKGNIFHFLSDPTVNAICVTTNGIVNWSGEAIMGAGTAGVLAKQFPAVKSILGNLLSSYGNIPHLIGFVDSKDNYHSPNETLTDKSSCAIWSFPTKYHFKDPSDIELIKKSATLLKEQADHLKYEKVLLPAPGIGRFTGKLNWSDIKAVIEFILDDRFHVVLLENDENKT